MIGPRSIARALSGDVVGPQVLCPGPGHGPSDRSLSVKLCASSPDGFIVHSFAGDDWQTCRDDVRDRLGLPRGNWKSKQRERRAPQPRPQAVHKPDDLDEAWRARDRAIARRLAGETVPLAGTPGEAYLAQTRKIDVSVLQDILSRRDAIGWHPAVYFSEIGHPLHTRRLGCIVAIMTDATTAEPTGAISRTYLASDLMKIGKAKTLGAPMGIVRLTPDDEVLQGLFLAEGIETALAAMSIGLRPMWSTGSTALMRSFPVLGGVEALNVIADHDPNGAGEKAAREAEARWGEAGREVRILRPESCGDLNDVLRGDAA